MKITKEWLEEKKACSWSLKYVCENSYIGLSITAFIKKLVNNDRLSDANWLITKYMDKTSNVKYAVYAAEQVIHIFENKYPDDKRPRKAIEAAKAYIDNQCEENKKIAYTAYADATYADAAAAAAYAAYTAYADADAAADATYATYADAAAAADATYATYADAAAAAAYAAYTAYVAYTNVNVAYTNVAANAANAYTAYVAYTAAYAGKELRIKILNYGLDLIK